MTLPWFTTISHQLEQRATKGALHHGLLFWGDSGIGKLEFAKAMATSLLCKSLSADGACGRCQSCDLLSAGNHPDYHIVESEKQIGVDSIRAAIQKLSGTAQLGHTKVLIIVGADTMTEAAANALLKTLEEPTSKTYLILLTESLNRLLPTILSRCEKIKLPTPTASQAKAWLVNQGYSDVSVAQLNAFGNAPFKVKSALDNNDALSFTEFNEKLESLQQGQIDVLSLATKWQSDAQNVVNWCQQIAHAHYIDSQGSKYYEQYKGCQEAQQRILHAGANKTLILVAVLKQFI